jgi:hypothetical protein
VALTWTETAGASSYTVWRKTAADADFARLDAGAGTIGLAYSDSAVQPGIAYTYIVAPVLTVAVWLPSNEVTVTAPSPDTTAPVARFTSPAAGSKVSGRVQVVASATDNVAVTRIELRLPSGVLVSVPGASITYEWSTKGLKRGSSQTLTVRAFDEAGNIGTATVTVTIK